jgi:peptide/nickel transport system ATP-binding protein
MTEMVDSGPSAGLERGETLLETKGLKKHFTDSDGILANFELQTNGGFPVSYQPERVRAVDGVDLSIKRGETLGLVGESGCGKSTLVRTILHLIEPTAGEINFKGRDLASVSKGEMRNLRKDMQMIFQDPQSSLNPRMRIGRIVEEPMEAHGLLDDEGRRRRAKYLLEKVGLDPSHYDRYPHSFSGGQRQRVNLARALSVNPDFIVCDEPVSSLDVSIQAQVLNTMKELQEEFGLTYLFIAHDLSVIRYISDRVAVMYLGKIAEIGDKETIFDNPKHPYTKALLDSVPIPDPHRRGERGVLKGDVPSPINPPSGCRFRTRCPAVIQPEAFNMTDAEWAQTLEFMRSVDRHDFTFDSREGLVERFFDGDLPADEVGSVVSRALDSLEEDEWDEAAELLADTFAEQSICATSEPDAYPQTRTNGTAHKTACHRHKN